MGWATLEMTMRLSSCGSPELVSEDHFILSAEISADSDEPSVACVKFEDMNHAFEETSP